MPRQLDIVNTGRNDRVSWQRKCNAVPRVLRGEGLDRMSGSFRSTAALLECAVKRFPLNKTLAGSRRHTKLNPYRGSVTSGLDIATIECYHIRACVSRSVAFVPYSQVSVRRICR